MQTQLFLVFTLAIIMIL